MRALWRLQRRFLLPAVPQQGPLPHRGIRAWLEPPTASHKQGAHRREPPQAAEAPMGEPQEPPVRSWAL